MSCPVIGITLDSDTSECYSKYPWYAIRENYATAINQAGGVPIMLSHEKNRIDEYLNLISGLLITGGAFDIEPTLFGDKTRHPTVTLKANRTDFEWQSAEKALSLDIPILGICGGQQLLNVVLGGTLIQHIPDEVENALPHEQPNPRDEAGHEVAVIEKTLLHRITNKKLLSVNSAHHQSVKNTGDGVVINAIAPDGVVEGIECNRYQFCMGIQWHPEFLIDPADQKIFSAFIKACKST